MQKESFLSAKGVLLRCKRGPFRMQKESFCEADVSLWLCKGLIEAFLTSVSRLF